MKGDSLPIETQSRWPHVYAIVLACATFPLIWVGGLVTTYDAGMAVPDWPTTYGYNMFLYPISTWVSGPWNLFIEHGHRLLGSVVGLLTIALNVAIWRCDPRRWMRFVGIAALILVISQGLLGGMRVRLSSTDFARAHGVTGPLFFALSIVICVLTSRFWWTRVRAADQGSSALAPGIQGVCRRSVFVNAWLLFGAAYCQLIIGAHLRHPNINWSPGLFRGVVFFHLVAAFVVLLQTIQVVARSRKLARNLSRPAWIVLALVTCQIVLGFATWRAKYGMQSFVPYAETTVDGPLEIAMYNAIVGQTIQNAGMVQVLTVTAHVALGSLVLATSAFYATRISQQFIADGSTKRDTVDRVKSLILGDRRCHVMSMTTVQVDSKSSPNPNVKSVAFASHLRDLADLTKPRISAMVLVTVVLSHFVASLGHPDLLVLFHILLGTTLVAASSGAFNQLLESDTDSRMPRTADRPLPAGRMSIAEVVLFGTTSLIAGLAYLMLTVGWHPTGWALATWLVYVCVYTPMKTRSHWNTLVGAISGAMPILIGWSATGHALDWRISGMLWLLFLWQFPHFLAIAWIYRTQYRDAGIQMITTTDPSGQIPGRIAFVGAILVWLSSLLPLLCPTHPYVATVYLAIATLLGGFQLRAARRFQKAQTDESARNLLLASVVYLPLALGLIAVQTVL